MSGHIPGPRFVPIKNGAIIPQGCVGEIGNTGDFLPITKHAIGTKYNRKVWGKERLGIFVKSRAQVLAEEKERRAKLITDAAADLYRASKAFLYQFDLGRAEDIDGTVKPIRQAIAKAEGRA